MDECKPLLHGNTNQAGAYTRSHFSSTGALLSTVQPNLTHECVLELLKLSSHVNECKPLQPGAHGQ